MSAYDERRQAHVARWGALLPDRLERLRWSWATIDEHRTSALRALVAAARDGSPWHRDRLAGVDIESLTGDDLTSLPTMTKSDLMANFDDVTTDRRVTLAAAQDHLRDLTTDAYLEGDLHVVASGGSSGQRGVFVYGWEAWIDVHLGLARTMISDRLAGPVDAGPVVMSLVAASNATHMTTAAAATFASPMVDVRPFPVTLPVPEIVAGLNAIQPAALTVYASMLGVLAGEAAAGRLRIAPRRIVATSEPLLPEVRAAAESAFGAPVANCWGTSEGGVMAVGCWQASGMHVSEDLVIIEPVDADGRPVEPGEPSAKVLLTNLFNPVLPLIRYELEDEVVLLPDACPCGSAHRRVGDVQGRVDDVFSYGSLTVHPHVLRSALGRCPEVVEYQVRRTARGVDVDVTGTVVDVDRVAKDLVAALEQVGLPDPEVRVERVPALERHPQTGKLKRFVSR